MNMAGPAIPGLTQPIHFTKNFNLLKPGTPATLDVTVANPTLLLQPFPHQQTDLAAISLSAQGGQGITFDGNKGSVNFKFSAKASAGAGVFLDGGAIAKALSLDSHIALDIPAGPAKHYTLMRSGFDGKASVNGSVALGAGASVSLGIDTSADAAFAVVRCFDDNAQTGLAELTAAANSWRLPIQVSTDADLDPGVWIVAEVAGSIAVKIGAQYGFNYNWIKTLKLGGLSGDVGLRLQLGINAALGLNASGTYAVVLSRDSTAPGGRVVRVRLFRESVRGWNFAFNAGVDVQPSVKLPATADDFIKAVFGVHGAQFIADLHAVEQWTGDNTTLGGLLASLGVDKSEELLTGLTGVDAGKLFTLAQSKLKSFLDQWDQFPQNVSSLVLKFVGDHVDLAPVKQVAGLVANGNESAFSSFLGGALKDIAFFQTPVGQFLEALSSKGVIGLLDSAQFSGVKDVAAKTLAILDGSDLEKILTNIQNKVAAALNLQPLIDLAHKVDQTTFDSLNVLLKAKLAAFLDKEIKAFGLEDLEKVRIAIGKILARRQEFYQKAKDALNHDYKFAFAATYQSQTTKDALIDVAFDFAGGDASALSALLRNAIDGKFDKVLLEPTPGVTINKAQLTHGLKRQSHAEFNMPYFSANSDDLLTSDAKVMPVEEQNGRILVYDLRSQDQAKARIGTKMQRSSTLAVAAKTGVAAGGPLRIHDGASLTYSYDFRQAVKAMSVSDFNFQSGKYVQAYFASLFDGSAGTSATWMELFEKKAGAGVNLGNTLLTLDVSVPSSVGAAWLTPGDANEKLRILRMKNALLHCLRQLIPFYYFADLSKFSEVGFASASLLAYEASRPQFAELDEINNPDVLRSILQRTVDGDDGSLLGGVLDFWFARLDAANHPNKKFFQNTGGNRATIVQLAGNMIRTVGSASNFGRLLQTDQAVLSSAENARKEMVSFLAHAAMKPEEAIAHLANFGADLVTGFNKNIANIYGGSALRPLGTVAFLEAARALAGAAPGVAPTANAMLDVAVVNVDPFQFADTPPAPNQIVAEDRLVAAGVTPSLPLG
jgi:hypothetical protein